MGVFLYIRISIFGRKGRGANWRFPELPKILGQVTQPLLAQPFLRASTPWQRWNPRGTASVEVLSLTLTAAQAERASVQVLKDCCGSSLNGTTDSWTPSHQDSTEACTPRRAATCYGCGFTSTWYTEPLTLSPGLSTHMHPKLDCLMWTVQKTDLSWNKGLPYEITELSRDPWQAAQYKNQQSRGRVMQTDGNL